MKNLKIATLLLLVVASSIIFIYYKNAKNHSYVELGVLDLNSSPSLDSNIISLNGTWEFYGDMLLTPEDFKKNTNLTTKYLDVPGKWEGLKNDSKGFGTYRMIIKNTDPSITYGLVKKNIRIASRIFVNGKMIMEDGYPSDIQSSEVVGNSSKILCFDVDKDTAEIIIQVSNFKYYSGGIIESIRFGNVNNIIQEYRQDIVFESIVFAIVIAIGFMHGVLALFIPKMKCNSLSLRLLPISVITFAIINGALSERVIKLIFPSLSSEQLIRIEYLAISLLIMSLFAFIHLLENKLIPTLAHRIIQIIYGIFILMILTLPMQNNQFWTIFTYFTTVIVAFGFVRVLVFYLMKNQLEISTVEHTIILVLLFIVNIYNADVYMFTFKHMSNMKIAMISTVFYALSWFSWMAYQYRVSFIKNDRLSIQLMNMNMTLEEEVHLRTNDLETAVEQLSKANKLLSIKSQEMERLATTDSLTGISNRLKLDEEFKREINMFERYGQIFSIILADIDSFKVVNDKFGHQTGDIVLKECANLLEKSIRKVDMIGRWGGEEFMVICPNTDLEGVKILAELMRKRIEENRFASQYKITVSLGVASFQSHDELSTIFKRVDKSLYDAKSNGKNRVGSAY